MKTVKSKNFNMIWLSKCSLQLLAVLACLIIIACSEYGDLSDEEYAVLIERTNEYLRHDMNHSWGDTYLMRNKTFRNSISLDNYVKTMEETGQGVYLREYRIEAYRISKDKNVVEIYIRFMHEHRGLDNKEITVTMPMMWIKENGAWYCVDAATRIYFPLNAGYIEVDLSTPRTRS